MSIRRRDYWDCIFETYHPPREHHPGVCPGCVLWSPRWGTQVEQEKIDAVNATDTGLTAEQAVRIQSGEVDCASLGIETERRAAPGWTSDERQSYIDEKW
jgi:hypothetical protein